MRQCPECKRLYAVDVDECPEDGVPTGAADPLLGRVVAGTYAVDTLLGRGAMGSVYRARQLQLDRVVALKVMLAHGAATRNPIERFRREALAVARLRHPNVVTIFDFGAEEHVGTFIVMEHLEGVTLAQEIRDRRRLEPDETVRLALRVCSGVQAAHEVDLIHRDLKPANIFLEKRGREVEVKVLDFGLVKMLEGFQSQTLTGVGAVVGTPAYLSPEQCEGHEVDRRSDVYSLGCVVYEMLTGRPPFMAPSTAALMFKHVSAEPAPPSQYARGVPKGLDDAVLRALEKAPSARYATAEAFGDALREGLAGTGSARSDATPIKTSGSAGTPWESKKPRDAALGAELTNLPAMTVSFVGRENELGHVRTLLAGARLLTLVGPGGIGKTRLAVELASRELDGYPDGVWFADLTPLERGSDVVPAIAAAVGVREQGGQPLRVTLLESLRHRRALVVLDNCEHVVDACAETVESLLGSCPGLIVLATSRETFRIDAETVHTVLPLALPDGTGMDEVSQSDAARLFVSRAEMKRSGFALTTENAGAIEALCRRLEGIPLALELAAARMTALTVEQILERLGDRFRLLSSSGRGVAAKQRTLRATVEWSYELLTGEERRMLRRLAVFEGGCTLAAAEEVTGCRLPVAGPESRKPATGNRQPATLELVEHLVDKSLLTVDTSGDQARYRMLETIRQFALEKLGEAGETDACRRRHIDLYLGWAAEAGVGLRQAKVALWLNRIDPEIDNFRTALRLAREQGSREEVARLATGLGMYWMLRGIWTEGLEWLGYATEGELPDDLLASSLNWIAMCASYRGETDRAVHTFERSLAIAQRLGDTFLVAQILGSQANLASHRGDVDRATELASESLKLYEGMNDESGIARVQRVFATIGLSRNDYDDARVWFERALATNRRLGDEIGISSVSFHLGGVELQVGNLDRAAEYLEAAEPVIRRLGDRFYLAYLVMFLGGLYRQRGDLARANTNLREGVRGMVALGALSQLVSGFEQLSLLAVAEGKPERALRLDGAGEMIRAEVAFVLTPENLAELRELLAPAWDALGDEVAERVRREGRELTVAEAIAYALEESGEWEGPRARHRRPGMVTNNARLEECHNEPLTQQEVPHEKGDT